MLELILSFFVAMVAGFIDFITDLFAKITNFSLDEFSTAFPVAGDFYLMFQSVAVGLVLAIAVFQLFKFFTGPLNKTTERPMIVLVRSFFAIGLIFFGNYLLEQIFNLVGFLYEAFLGTSRYGSLGAGGASVARLSELFTEYSVGDAVADVTATQIGGGAIMLMILIMCIALVIQYIKMMLELVERYLMLCLLVYSSPLAYSTFTSENTVPILKKWISMFVSQSMLLILTAWGSIMFQSVLVGYGTSIFAKLIFAFAMIKIVKRFDNYLNQLGMNAAITGGPGMLESIGVTGLGMLKMLGGGGGGAKAGGKGGSPLGKRLMQRSPLAQSVMGGVAGAKAAPKGFRSKLGGVASGVAQGQVNASKFGAGVKGGVDAIKDKQGFKGVVGGVFNGAKGVTGKTKATNATSVKEAMGAGRMSAIRNDFASAVQSGDAETIGKSASDTLRSLLNAEPGTVNPNLASTITGEISDALQDNPQAAFEFMQDVAENGGLTLSAENGTDALAGTVMGAYMGSSSVEEALESNAASSVGYQSGNEQITNQRLVIEKLEEGGNAFSYSATTSKGNTYAVSNENGRTAKSYAEAVPEGRTVNDYTPSGCARVSSAPVYNKHGDGAGETKKRNVYIQKNPPKPSKDKQSTQNGRK